MNDKTKATKQSRKMLKPKIGNKQYVVVPYPAGEAWMFQLRLIKYGGPMMAKFLPLIGAAAPEDGEELQKGDFKKLAERMFNADNKVLFDGLSSALADIEPEPVFELMRDLIEHPNVSIEGEEVIFDDAFGENLYDAIALLRAILSSNYGGFLRAFGRPA